MGSKRCFLGRGEAYIWFFIIRISKNTKHVSENGWDYRKEGIGKNKNDILIVDPSNYFSVVVEMELRKYDGK